MVMVEYKSEGKKATRKRKRRQYYRVGHYYLTRLSGDTTWYVAWYDRAIRQRKILSTGIKSDLSDNDPPEAAKRKIHQHLNEHLMEQPVHKADPARVPLKHLLVEYWNEHGLFAESMSPICSQINYALEFFGEDTVSALTPDRTDDFIKWLAQQGLSCPSVALILTSLRAALNRAKKMQRVTDVPHVRYVKADEPLFKNRPPFQRYRLSTVEMAQLFDASPPHIKVALMVASCTCARPENVLDLRIDQVDLENNCIRLNPAERHQTKKFRGIVPIPEALKPYIRFALEKNQRYLVEYRGRPIRSVKTAMRRLRRLLNLPAGFDFKSVRHTVLTTLRQKKVNPWEVSVMGGHAVPEGLKKTTLIYAVATPQDMGYGEESVAAIDWYMSQVQACARGPFLGDAAVALLHRDCSGAPMRGSMTWADATGRAKQLLDARIADEDGKPREMTRAEIEHALRDGGATRNVAQSASSKVVKKDDPGNDKRRSRNPVARRVGVRLKQRMHELRAQGLSISEIAKEVGANPRTVKKHLRPDQVDEPAKSPECRRD